MDGEKPEKVAGFAILTTGFSSFRPPLSGAAPLELARFLLLFWAMANLLIVEDEDQLRENIAGFLRSYSDEFEVITAATGEQGLEEIRTRSVDLLLTDVRLPGIDGIEVVCQALKVRPQLKVVVMTAFSSSEMRDAADHAGALRFVEKPVDLHELRKTLLEVSRTATGWACLLGGLDIFDLVQLLAVTRKRRSVRIANGRHEGMLVFDNGSLTHASSGELEGEEAFFEMVRWHGGSFEESPEPSPGQPLPNISVSVAHLMMEAARRRDEVMISEKDFGPPGPLGVDGAVVALSSWQTPEDGSAEVAPPVNQLQGVCPRASGANLEGARKDATGMEAYLEQLKSIRGYLASVILDSTGQVLALHSAGGPTAFEAASAAFGEVFRCAHEGSSEFGLGAYRSMLISTSECVVMTECSGEGSSVHIHWIVVLALSGNQALTKMSFKRLMPQVVAELS